MAVSTEIAPCWKAISITIRSSADMPAWRGHQYVWAECSRPCCHLFNTTRHANGLLSDLSHAQSLAEHWASSLPAQLLPNYAGDEPCLILSTFVKAHNAETMHIRVRFWSTRTASACEEGRTAVMERSAPTHNIRQGLGVMAPRQGSQPLHSCLPGQRFCRAPIGAHKAQIGGRLPHWDVH